MIEGAASEQATLTLLSLSAQPMVSSSSMPDGVAVMKSNSVAMATTSLRMVCSLTVTSASREACGGTVPGFLRASARTNAPARDTASAAIPSHTADHRMCEYETIVWADESPNGPGSTCISGM